ncbi:hypothetical protein PR048_030353 [Dryococelus australis]|uniref:YqaJ viral recombinase domain-containing protein n=1 Tax=Dryococelus australis TaxID=614101 RepID=A0ABQ9GBG4_9NEOP|nr:hypothetical protein PR048_030353 [Dryococelus australis]
MTVLQSSCHLWNTERRKLLTTSNFGRVCKMRATISCKNLVRSILYGNFSTKGTWYGIANEPVAKRKMVEEHGKVAIECDLGLFVDSEYPFLGATPDGLVGEDAIMEIKFPLSADKYGSPKEAVDNDQMSYCADVNGKPLLRRDSKYYYHQVQRQLHITGSLCCLHFPLDDVRSHREG